MTTSSTFNASSAKDYEQVMGRWSRRLAEKFLDFAGCLDGESVLDAGCGTGSLSEAIVARTSTTTLHGIDLADAYVDYAQARLPEPRATFSVGDVCSLPFEDGRFDRVLSLLVLHFVPRGAAAVAELRRVAKPGATVAATVWDARGGFVTSRMFCDTAAMLDPRAGEMRARSFTRPMTRPGELAAAWQEAGFREVQDTMLAIRMDFETFEDFWRPYTGSDGPGAAYVATLDNAKRDALRKALRSAYLDGEEDGPRSYAAVAWAVKGIA